MVEQAIERIVAAPGIWPRYLHDTRKCSMRVYPYLIVYREADSIIQIIAVAHVARRPGYWRNRIDRDG